MKLIPAFARIWSPLEDSRPATMAIPIMQETAEKSISLRRPTWSMIAVPESAPMKEVTEFTKLSTRWRSGLVMPACFSSTGRKSSGISHA